MANNVHIPWIKITLNNKVSLTWRSNPSSPDYFTSLTNKRTVEQAALIDLNITYCPHVGEDCNMIEKAIVESPVCTVQYGDSYGSRTVSSRVYRALIYSYSTQFNEGFLSYSFKLVSASVPHNFDKCKPTRIPPKGLTSVSANSVGIEIQRLVQIHLGEDYTYDYKSSEEALTGATIYNDSPVEVESGLSPIKTMMALLKALPPFEDGATRVLEIDDSVNSEGKGTIRVVKYGGSGTVPSSLSFEWGTRDGTVLEWSPNYDGSVAIFRNYSDIGVTATSLYNADTGKPITLSYDKASAAASNLISTDTSNSVYNAISSISEFSKLADYPYCATLTVLGEDRFVSPASTRIKVTPVIMGVAHHSAGTYAAKSIIDTVDGSGFTTTYELYRTTDQGEKAQNDNEGEEEAGIFYNGEFMSYSEYSKYSGY